MKVEINGNEIRIIGERGVDLRVYASSDKDGDTFSSSLCFDGMEHGGLPMIEVSGKRNIVITNTLDKGKTLYR